jgi:hypothetical protein
MDRLVFPIHSWPVPANKSIDSRLYDGGKLEFTTDDLQSYAMERKPKGAGTTEHYLSLQLSPNRDCSGSIISV